MADSVVGPRVVWPHYSKDNIMQADKRKPSDALGKDQFLSILVAQLRNQDPMQPMQDRDFIAQMAQFTAVEQQMNMANELALLRQSIGSASSIIGKSIQWHEYDGQGEVVTLSGTVDAVLSKDGLLYAKVGDEEVAMDYVISISDDPLDTEEPGEPEPEEPGTEEPGEVDPENPGDSSGTGNSGDNGGTPGEGEGA
ncbi:flagellar hook capping protein [Paenibacillus sp. J5C_2022]|uniref:flagellar hook capping FlgD N-terminal domain-containing protein n=1 Tax=Paenibacillus sp. J5C2022 TaxID=2977129 RepID=UPI0021D2FA99|nr:flagellar hook capping FlgD N-terminal domain-containing protein [Paenibacillus sp. J5C2022]MCU6707106.1 flagellar hook capping protein [Paenibacillus sp. J5C2022]